MRRPAQLLLGGLAALWGGVIALVNLTGSHSHAPVAVTGAITVFGLVMCGAGCVAIWKALVDHEPPSSTRRPIYVDDGRGGYWMRGRLWQVGLEHLRPGAASTPPPCSRGPKRHPEPKEDIDRAVAGCVGVDPRR